MSHCIVIHLQRIYNFDCFMLFYYQSWMFYNHFISILVLTYWHSAKCQLLFLHVFYVAGNRYQTESKRSETFCGFFWSGRQPMGRRRAWGVLRGEHNPPRRAWRPRRPSWVVPTSGARRTASLLYKYPNIPETLGESTKINSSRHRVQNHQIQSRHHHGGVHHPHWCLSDDAWVFHLKPTGP